MYKNYPLTPVLLSPNSSPHYLFSSLCLLRTGAGDHLLQAHACAPEQDVTVRLIEYFEVRHPLIRIEMAPTSGYDEKTKRPWSLFITGEMRFLPLFVVVRKPGWFDGYAALVIPPLFGASGIFLLRLFFRYIPRDLEDPARIDGCAVLGIILPLGRSAQVSLGLFAFIGEWGRFLRPLVVINLREGQPIQLGIAILPPAVSSRAATW